MCVGAAYFDSFLAYPSNNGRDYYTGVLTRMASLSDFTKAKKPGVRSTERMEWLLLDGGSR